MSEVERLFYRLQEETGGNMKWGDLSLKHQQVFISAVNYLLEISAIRV